MKSGHSLLATTLALAGCVHGHAPSDDSERTLRIGQAGDFGLVIVRPLQVIEDSRCPAGVQCIWAGQVRVRAEIQPPAGGHERTLVLGEEQSIAGGQLLLREVRPAPASGQPIDPDAYRLVLHYRMPRQD